MMMPVKSLLLLLCMLQVTHLSAQTPSTVDSVFVAQGRLDKLTNGAEIVLGTVSKPPKFPGGKEGWIAFLQKEINQHTPLINRAPAGQYHVVMRYMIDKEGKIKEVTAESNCGYGMEQEVKRAMMKSPVWTAASTVNNESVTFVTRQTVSFFVKGLDSKIRFQ